MNYKEALDKIKRFKEDGTIFSDLRELNNATLEIFYSYVFEFGPQQVGQEKTDRFLSHIIYELNLRESNHALKQMRVLTYTAICLSAVQALCALIGFLKHWY